jgi:mRNA-degrading endonuclease RelE of RelBE toxin-antitoxin system
MQNNYRVLTTEQADRDLDRLTDYLELLETKNKRLNALVRAVIDLQSRWKLHGYYDRPKNIRVNYIDGWYSVFFTVDEETKTVLVVAMLGQAEDFNRF